MTKIKHKNVESSPKSAPKHSLKVLTGDARVFLIHDSLMEEGNSKSNILKLKNPATGLQSLYVLNANGSLIFEIVQYSEAKRSWFINQTVCSNGQIMIASPIDPLFLALPYFESKCEKYAMLLDQILCDENFFDISRLVDILKPEQLEKIADKKDSLDAFTYNPEKTLKWLVRKCQRLAKKMEKMKIQMGYESSATFVKSEKLKDSVDSGVILKHAFNIISDYLSSDVCEKLRTALMIPIDLPEPTSKRSSNKLPDEPDAKKIKLESLDSSFEAKAETKPEKRIKTVNKALAKAASGSKSISSFFTKK